MLAIQNLAGRIGTARRVREWNGELETIIEFVTRRFSDSNGNGYFPHPDEVAMQRALLNLPMLGRLAQDIRGSGAGGMTISALGLAGLDEASRNAVLYAIGLCLGFPTSSDQRTRRVAWDVRSRPAAPGTDQRFTTFSERVGSADMHTDSSFYPMPEEQFLLYVVSAARCNGGESLLIDVDDVRSALQGTAAGRIAFDLLATHPLPFRVPAIYAAGDDQLEYFLGPVFGTDQHGNLTMRWRHDSIMKGLAARPDLGSPALFAALDLVNQVVERHAPRFERHLADDTLLWADNRRMLHGRANYSDAHRHLIRIRISDTPNAERIGPSGVGAD